jgi:murein DD-endopeptidase MepM/ murein hydrolase activator NlpD
LLLGFGFVFRLVLFVNITPLRFIDPTGRNIDVIIEALDNLKRTERNIARIYNEDIRESLTSDVNRIRSDLRGYVAQSARYPDSSGTENFGNDILRRSEALLEWSRYFAKFEPCQQQVVWPVPTHHTFGTSIFGMRFHPIYRRYIVHTGIDIGMPVGTELFAIMDGYVEQAGWRSGYGNVITILHDNGFRSYYAHLDFEENDGFQVEEGQRVFAGQLIALSGSTGVSTSPHLHFEILNSSRQRINPLSEYHPHSDKTTNENPFFIVVNGTYVFNPNFCWDTAEEYSYSN